MKKTTLAIVLVLGVFMLLTSACNSQKDCWGVSVENEVETEVTKG